MSANTVMFLCHECAARVRVSFPNKELRETGAYTKYENCGNCRKKRFSCEYELVDKGEK